MDEDSKAVGVGLQWLTHLANGNDKNQYLSNGGKVILSRLLKDNYLRDDTKNKNSYSAYSGDEDEDEEDEDEESGSDDNMELSLFRGRRQRNNGTGNGEDEASKRPKLFETILGIIYKLHQKHNHGNDTSKDTVKTPTTKEILKECITRLEQSQSEDAEILRPANIPCSLDSNQFIFSALLFLSEDIYQDISSIKSSSSTDVEGRSPSDNLYFPKMPLLLKRKISSTSSGGGSIMIPGGFLINFQNIMLSSEEGNSSIFDKEFLLKLSMLESCFLSLSSKIEHIPRLHVIPRIGMGYIKNREEEEKLMKLGDVEKAGLKRINQTGGKSTSNDSVDIERKSKSLKRKISSVGNHSDNE